MLSCIQLFVTPWTVACQTPLFMEISRQEYWSGLPFPFPGVLPYPGIQSISFVSLALAGRFFPDVPPELSKVKVKVTFPVPFFVTLLPWPTRLLCPWNFPGKNKVVGCYALLQGIFPTELLNPVSLHCGMGFLPIAPPGNIQSTIVIVQSLSCVQLFATPWTVAHQSSLFFIISRRCSNSCPLSHWCHTTISSFVIHFPYPSCLQSLPASGSFLMSWLFSSDGQIIGTSGSASALPMNIQDWFPLGLTYLLSLQSKGLSRLSSNTTVQKHQFFSTQPSCGPTLTSVYYMESIINWLFENM